MLPSNTDVPEVDNAPSGNHANQCLGCIPQCCIYMCIGHWLCMVSISLLSRLCCLPPFSLGGYIGSGHETRRYGTTGYLQF